MILEVPSLVWVFAFAVIIELICVRLRIPSVIGLLFAGMIIGPHVLNLVSEEDIAIFAEIGAMLLLFSIGVEFSIENFIKMGLRPIITGLTKILLIFFLTQNILTLIGFDFITSIIIAMSISSSSTALIVRILQQKNLMYRSESKLLLTILILEDIMAIFYLAIISALLSTNKTINQFNFSNFLSNFVLSIAILLFVYLIFKRILLWLSKPIITYGSEGSLIFSTILVAMLMSSIAKAVNLSSAIGAFLAGSMIVSLPRHTVFKNAIKPFDITFSSIFFISIGMLINPNIYFTEHLNVLGLAIISIIIVFASSFTSIYLFGIPKNGSSALLIAALATIFGEFTLLIAQQAQQLSSFDFIGYSSSVVLIAALINPVLVDKNEHLRRLLKLIIKPEFIKQIDVFITYINLPINELAKQYDKLLKFDFQVFRRLATIDSLRIYLMIAYLITFLLIAKADLPGEKKTDILILLFLLILPIVLKSFIDFFNLIFSNFGRYICNCQKAFEQISRSQIAITTIEALMLLLLTFMIPIIFHLFGISRISIFFYAPLLFIALIFFYRSIKKINENWKKK